MKETEALDQYISDHSDYESDYIKELFIHQKNVLSYTAVY